jgi:hypothetical protein
MQSKLGTIIDPEPIGGGPESDGGQSTGENRSIGGLPVIELPTLSADGNISGESAGTDSTTITGQPEFEPPRRRGRPPGSVSRKTEKISGTLIPDLERLLFSANLMLAAICKTPELEIDKQEAQLVAEAVKELAKHYPVGMDPKKIAWANLIAALGTVYGPRVMVIWQKPGKPRAVVQEIPRGDTERAAKSQAVNRERKISEMSPSDLFGFNSPEESSSGL